MNENNILEGSKNLRQLLFRMLALNNRKKIILISLSTMSLFSFIFYVISTYIHDLEDFQDKLDLVVCFVYLCDLIMNLILSHDRINHLLSYQTILDLATTFSPLFWVISFLNFIQKILKIILIKNFSKKFTFKI